MRFAHASVPQALRERVLTTAWGEGENETRDSRSEESDAEPNGETMVDGSTGRDPERQPAWSTPRT